MPLYAAPFHSRKLGRGRREDVAAAQQLLADARTTASTFGMDHLLATIDHRR